MPKNPWPPLPDTGIGVNGRLDIQRPRVVTPEHLGEFTSEDRVVKVQRNLKRPIAWRVYYHEWTHSCLDDCGVQLTEDQEEAVCQAIAAGRLAELRASISEGGE